MIPFSVLLVPGVYQAMFHPEFQSNYVSFQQVYQCSTNKVAHVHEGDFFFAR